MDLNAFSQLCTAGPVPADSEREQADEILTAAQADGRALRIDLGLALLEVSIARPDPELPIEVSVQLAFHNGDRQDLAVVYPLECGTRCEVLVWSDPEVEHNTHLVEIPVKNDLELW